MKSFPIDLILTSPDLMMNIPDLILKRRNLILGSHWLYSLNLFYTEPG
jgi:hypothetical protein